MAQVVIKNFVVRDRNFTIVKDERGFYCAIEDKHITNGRLNKTLNGFQMFADKELDSCLHTCERQVEIEYHISQGKSKAEAFAIVYNMMDRVQELEALFAH